MNLFWYNFWYSDKNASLLMHSDLLINRLVYTYISFGLHFHKNFFVNPFWFSSLKRKVTTYKNEYDLKYFRTLEYRNKIFNETSFIKLRKKKKNAYFSRFWILKFQNWVVVNLYMFQPYKTRRYKKKSFYARTGFVTPQEHTIKAKERVLAFKHDLARKYYLSLFLSNQTYYNF